MLYTTGVCSTIRERGCVWSLPVFIRGVERCSITALDNHSHPHLLFWDHVWTLKLNRKITAPWEERTQQQEVNCSVTEFLQSQVFFYSTFILLTNVSGHSRDPHAKYITSMMAINIYWHYKQHYIPPLTFAVRRRRTGGERGCHWWEWWTSLRVSSGPPLHGLGWSTSSWKCGLCQRCIVGERGGRWDKGGQRTVRH